MVPVLGGYTGCHFLISRFFLFATASLRIHISPMIGVTLVHGRNQRSELVRAVRTREAADSETRRARRRWARQLSIRRRCCRRGKRATKFLLSAESTCTRRRRRHGECAFVSSLLPSAPADSSLLSPLLLSIHFLLCFVVVSPMRVHASFEA